MTCMLISSFNVSYVRIKVSSELFPASENFGRNLTTAEDREEKLTASSTVTGNEQVGVSRKKGFKTNGFIDVPKIALLLKRCSSTKALSEGQQIHRYIMQNGLDQHVVLSNLLIQMYGKCEDLQNARAVFDKMCIPNIYSWNILIAVYVQHRHLEEALVLFYQMPVRDIVTWNTMIAAYGQQGNLEIAIKFFKQMPQQNVVSWNAIIMALIKQGHIKEADQWFEQMPQRNVISWNTMIAGHAEHGHLEDALRLFARMSVRNVITWNSIIGGFVKRGQIKNALKLFQLMPERSVVSWNIMLAAFGQQGQVNEACILFQQMPQRDVASYNAMISAFIKGCQLNEAVDLFKQMPYKDVISWTAIIAAYGQHGKLEEARHVFEQVPRRNVVSWTAIISAYIQHEKLAEALQLFEEMPKRDILSWNVIMTGCIQQGQYKKALLLFQQLVQEGMKPDRDVVVTALDACARISAFSDGKELHALVAHSNLELDVCVRSALISMYARCGSLEDACRVFDETPAAASVLWDALILAYAHYGHGKMALQVFHQMVVEGLMINEITLNHVLYVCSHAGLADECCHLFTNTTPAQPIVMDMEHYGCIGDLLGRAGWLDEAEAFLNCLPFQPDATSWTALLSSSAVHADLERGKRAATCFLELEPVNSAPMQ